MEIIINRSVDSRCRYISRPFLYREYKCGIKESNVLHHINNVEHSIKQNISYKKKCLYWHEGNLSYTSMILYIKPSSRGTFFLKSIPGDEDSQVFLYILSVIVSMISYFHVCNFTPIS